MSSPSRAGDVILSWLYPPRCQLCGCFHSAPLCERCLEGVPTAPVARCRRCGLFLDPLIRGAVLCAECRRTHRDPLHLARAAGPHQGHLRDLVAKLKYQRRRRAAAALGLVAARWLSDDAEADAALDFTAAEALVPVPLHYRRRWWRGFNQAELLAGELARLTGRPTVGLLRRVRATPPQVGLDRAQRRRNVAGAFEVVAGGVCRGAYYLLVDDVYTTGATLRECASVLRRAGAGQVAAVTLTRRVETEDATAGQDDPGGD